MQNVIDTNTVVTAVVTGKSQEVKIQSGAALTVKRKQHVPAHVRYPFSAVLLAASLKEEKEDMHKPLQGLVAPVGKTGKPVHTSGFGSPLEFLNFLLRINYVFGVSHSKVGELSFRSYVVAVPHGYAAYAGNICWADWWNYVSTRISPVQLKAADRLRVKIVNYLPVIVTDAVLPRTNRLTFILEVDQQNTSFYGWCAGEDLLFVPTIDRLDVLDCVGTEIEDQLED